MEGRTYAGPCTRRALALLLVALLVFAAIPTGNARAESEITAKTQTEAPKVTMELHPYGENRCKLTVFGTGELLRYYRTTVPDYQCQFRYQVHFTGEREYDLTGRIKFYHYPNETGESIHWISSKLTCKNIVYDVDRANTDDPEKISWVIEFPTSAHFDGGKNLESVDFTFYNAYETRQKVTERFNAADIVTDTLVTTALKPDGNGTLQVVVPEGKNDRLDVYLTDPDLAAGYPVSKTPGTLAPKWKVMVSHGSYNWYFIELDGSDSKSLDDLKLSAGMFWLRGDQSNKYRSGPEEISGCTYEVKGDTLVLHFVLPPEFPIDTNDMKWVEVALQDGAVSNKYKLY